MDNKANTTKEKIHHHDDHHLPCPNWLGNPQPLLFIVGVEQPEQRNLLHRSQQATDGAAGTHVEVAIEGTANGKWCGRQSIQHTTHCEV